MQCECVLSVIDNSAGEQSALQCIYSANDKAGRRKMMGKQACNEGVNYEAVEGCLP